MLMLSRRSFQNPWLAMEKYQSLLSLRLVLGISSRPLTPGRYVEVGWDYLNIWKQTHLKNKAKMWQPVRPELGWCAPSYEEPLVGKLRHFKITGNAWGRTGQFFFFFQMLKNTKAGFNNSPNLPVQFKIMDGCMDGIVSINKQKFCPISTHFLFGVQFSGCFFCFF